MAGMGVRDGYAWWVWGVGGVRVCVTKCQYSTTKTHRHLVKV